MSASHIERPQRWRDGSSLGSLSTARLEPPRERGLILCMTLCFLAFMHTAHAADWPHWRGPAFTGSSPEANLPASWSKDDALWKTPLPGPSAATPVIADDSIFVTSADAQKNLLVLCLDRKTGKERWRKVAGVGDRSQGHGHNMASPSPVTDGQRVFALFGTGDLIALDSEGKVLWARSLAKDYGKFAIQWLYGSSPLLYKDKLYVQVLQRDPPTHAHATDTKPTRESFLLCIDPATGNDLWRCVRKTDASAESMEAYSSPIPFEGNGRPEIIVSGANAVTGHDPETGDELWRWPRLNPRNEVWWRVVTSPVPAGNLIVAGGPNRDPIYALRSGGKGVLDDKAVSWTFREFPPDVCTPVFHGGKLFVLDGDKQMLTCLDPKNGAKLWQGNLGVKEIFRASPTAADGKLYTISEKGNVVVLDAGDGFKILSTIEMGEALCRSSIAFAQGQLFIRTAENLYCFGAKR